MATPGRRADAYLDAECVLRALFERGYEYDFFQAVRLLYRLHPERQPVGGTAKPRNEVARFRTQLSMAFPPSAVHDIQQSSDNSAPAEVTVAFMGLMGSQGVLPVPYTERMIARRSAHDDAMEAFLNLFNHRWVSLFYQAWQKHRAAVLYEQAAVRAEQPDPFTARLYSFVGLGTGALRGRMRIKDETILLYGGVIAQRPHSATALRNVLRDYFSLPVHVDQFVGSWYELDHADRSYMSAELQRNQLGVGAFIGSRVWDQQARIRIRLGPLRLDEFRQFLPGSAAMARLAELTRFMVGQALVFDVQPTLRAPEVPYCRLSDRGPDAPRLGWMAWLKTRELRADADDAVFAHVN